MRTREHLQTLRQNPWPGVNIANGVILAPTIIAANIRFEEQIELPIHLLSGVTSFVFILTGISGAQFLKEAANQDRNPEPSNSP